MMSLKEMISTADLRICYWYDNNDDILTPAFYPSPSLQTINIEIIIIYASFKFYVIFNIVFFMIGEIHWSI